MVNIDDEIYQEIKIFKDYELTQCIAYEMAIRNDKVLDKIAITIDYFKENKNIILAHKGECTYYFGGQTNIYFCKLLQMIKNIEVLSINWEKLELNHYDKRIDKRLYIMLQMLRPIYYRVQQFKLITDSVRAGLENYDFKSTDKDTYFKIINKILFHTLHHKYNTKLKNEIKTLIFHNENTKNILSEIISILDKSIKYFPKERLLTKTEDGYSLFTTGMTKGLTRIYKESISDGYKIIYEVKLDTPDTIFENIKISNNKRPLKDFNKIKSIKELADYVYVPTKNAISIDSGIPLENLPNNNIINLVTSSSRIEPKFKRPLLNIDTLQSKRILGEIDFSLPKKDLLSYVKMLKEEIDNNYDDIILTPSEILGEDFHVGIGKKINGEIARSLFVYDYVKILQKKSIHTNAALKETIKTRKQEIENNKSLYSEQKEYNKKLMLKTLSKEFVEGSIDDILRFLDTTENLPFSTTKKDYYKMSKYIDKEEYKILT